MGTSLIETRELALHGSISMLRLKRQRLRSQEILGQRVEKSSPRFDADNIKGMMR